MQVIEDLEISAIFPREALKSWAVTEIDQIALRRYQNALDRLYLSKRVSHSFHLFLRLLDRIVIDAVIGPDPAVSMENSLTKLTESTSLSVRRRTALKHILVSRMRDAMKDIPKARKELSASFQIVQGRCLKGRASAKSAGKRNVPTLSGLIERKNISLRERPQFNAEEKVKILRQHLVDRTAVSVLCKEHQISPSLFYQWQRTFFENGSKAFNDQRKLLKPR